MQSSGSIRHHSDQTGNWPNPETLGHTEQLHAHSPFDQADLTLRDSPVATSTPALTAYQYAAFPLLSPSRHQPAYSHTALHARPDLTQPAGRWPETWKKPGATALPSKAKSPPMA